MSYDLIQKEKTYLNLLKEMKMMTHVGSGPKDPAPKEKETKSPVEDGTGTGTKQAATGHPNVIPPISYLKKELAKEGVVLVCQTKRDLFAEIQALPREDKLIVKQIMREMKDDKDDKDEKDDKDDMCPECNCDPCECKKKVAEANIKHGVREDLANAIEMCGMDHGDPDHKKKHKKKMSEAELSGQANADAGDQSLDMEKIDPDDLDKKGDGSDEGSGEAVGEQGSTFHPMDLKTKNRMSQDKTPRRIAGSPADRQAKAAAFEKQKAIWNAKQKLPEQVQHQRKAVPQVDEISENYKEHFKSMMKKHGVKNLATLSNDEKKSFFKKVDSSWKGVKEQMAAAMPAAAPAAGSGAISAGNIARSDSGTGRNRMRRKDQVGPSGSAATPQNVVAIKPRPAVQVPSTSTRLANRMRGQTSVRPLPGQGTPRPIRTGRL